MKSKLSKPKMADWRSKLAALAGVHPNIEKIILFGSFARGTESLRSDVDLVIIMNTSLPFLNRGKTIHKEILKIFTPYSIDFLIYTPEEFKRMEMSDNPFVKRVLKEGKVLYER